MAGKGDSRAPGVTRKALLLGACAVAVAVVGMLDLRVGGAITLSVFYVVPVALVTWWCGRRVGLPMAMYAVAVWSVADFTSLDQTLGSAVPWWNAGVRLAFFIGVVLVVAALRTALASERQLARRDAATGIANAREFSERAEVEMRRMRRFEVPLCVAFCDVDNLKIVNDTFGHSAGDALLAVVAETLHNVLRQTDLVARLGGDEFGILLPDTGEAAGLAALGKSRLAVNKAIREAGWPATLSVGAVTTTHAPSDGLPALLAQADAHLYAIKQAGRDGLFVGNLSGASQRAAVPRIVPSTE